MAACILASAHSDALHVASTLPSGPTFSPTSAPTLGSDPFHVPQKRAHRRSALHRLQSGIFSTSTPKTPRRRPQRTVEGSKHLNMAMVKTISWVALTTWVELRSQRHRRRRFARLVEPASSPVQAWLAMSERTSCCGHFHAPSAHGPLRVRAQHPDTSARPITRHLQLYDSR